MLTYNDETVDDALSIFRECAGLVCDFWGFKDVGLPEDRMKELVTAMKQAGKTMFLEVVSLTEEECLRGARIAVECGFDYLMDTVFSSPSSITWNPMPSSTCPSAARLRGTRAWWRGPSKTPSRRANGCRNWR
jgi:hypothetical protein